MWYVIFAQDVENSLEKTSERAPKTSGAFTTTAR